MIQIYLMDQLLDLFGRVRLRQLVACICPERFDCLPSQERIDRLEVFKPNVGQDEWTVHIHAVMLG